MALEHIIQRLFAQNSDYSNPGQATNQARSLNSLSRDLYTDHTRFVYELLQNADDSAPIGTLVKVALRLYRDTLVVAHTGKPNDERDLEGLCAVDNGTKKNDQQKTGFKGIGFKAVFGQSDNVIVCSQGEYFRFDKGYVHNWRWDADQLTWEKDMGRQFEFPWQIIPIYTKREEIPADIADFLNPLALQFQDNLHRKRPEKIYGKL